MSDSAAPTLGDATLRRIVDRIVEGMHPQRIVLFGSRATGGATGASDYGLCVIADTDREPHERSTAIHHLFPRRDFSMDVFVLTPKEFNEQKDVANTLGHIVARDGKVLYEHA